MDARVKPAHDALVSRSRVTGSNSRHAASLLFFGRPGAGRSFSSVARPKEEGRAGRLRVQTDPRTSTPRDIEVVALLRAVALRRVDSAASPPSLGVPRAMFVGLLRMAPGGLDRFRQLAPLLTDWPAAYPPLSDPNGAQHI